MPDISTLDLAAALGRRGCALCRALAEGERHYLASFAREGRFAPRARARFRQAGGYCGRHAWLLHAIASESRHGMVMVDLYEQLIDSDRVRLREVSDRLAKGRSRGIRVFPRRGSCPACEEEAARIDRKCVFFVQLLREPGAWNAYQGSDGLCLPHLGRIAENAAIDSPEIARRLLQDADRRLAELSDDLAEFDRKRDYRYAHEPKGKEQGSWTRVVELYAGNDSAALLNEPRQ